MAFTTTSNFSGKAAGFYISAALKEAKSLEYLTMIENVKYKSNIQKQALSGVLADATCDFTDAGTLAMTEAVLEVKNLQVNLDLCKSTFVGFLGSLTNESWCWCASSCFF
jgi:ABC-type molybdate transport system substrate-binding protein